MSVPNVNSKSAKQTKAGKRPGKKAIVVTKEVGNYEKHPFFVKKANEMKELLEKVGLPKRIKAKTS